MEPDLREYIRDVYRSLTDIGTEADQTVDARFAVGAKPTQNGAPAVQVTQPETPARRPSEPRAQPQPAMRAQPQPAIAQGLSVANPFGVVAAAVRAIVQNRAQAFWLGLLVVAPLTILSNVLLLQNVRQGVLLSGAAWLQFGVLVVVIYLLCWWIRVGRSGIVKSSAALKFADVLAFGAVAAAAALVWPIVFDSYEVPDVIQAGAYLTHVWPLNGPYASVTFYAVMGSSLPPATPFVETFTHAASLLPALPFVPFIVGENVRPGEKLGHLLLRIPFLLAALALCTLPIAILNAVLADWASGLVRAGNTLPVCFIMGVAFYVHLLLSAVTIGEFYRRVAASHP
jgi:hypothetical protein